MCCDNEESAVFPRGKILDSLPNLLICAQCEQELPQSSFSVSQLRKYRSRARCQECIGKPLADPRFPGLHEFIPKPLAEPPEPRSLLVDPSDPSAERPAPLHSDDPVVDPSVYRSGLERFRVAQANDSRLLPLISFKRTGIYPRSCVNKARYAEEAKRYAIEDGTLFRRVEHRNEHFLAVVVPDSLQRYILGLFHNNPFCAHFGAAKMLARLRTRFYWSHMTSDCENWSRGCLTCKLRKSVANSKAGIPGVTPQALRPGDLLSIDFLGPFKKTPRGNEYLCNLVDHFTRHTAIVPTRSKESSEAVRAFFEGWIVPYGIPRAVLHDRGGEFNSRLIKKLFKTLDVLDFRTTPPHPYLRVCLTF